MSWGDLKPFRSDRVLNAVLSGKTVVDLGAGDLMLTRYLLRTFKPAHVIAVEKDWRPVARVNPRISVFAMPFDTFVKLETIWDAAFLSYPVNYRVPGLLTLLDRAPYIVVLSENFDGGMTGWPVLWKYLSGLRALAYQPHPRNSLTIYAQTNIKREPTPDEQAGMDMDVVYPHPSKTG